MSKCSLYVLFDRSTEREKSPDVAKICIDSDNILPAKLAQYKLAHLIENHFISNEEAKERTPNMATLYNNIDDALKGEKPVTTIEWNQNISSCGIKNSTQYCIVFSNTSAAA